MLPVCLCLLALACLLARPVVGGGCVSSPLWPRRRRSRLLDPEVDREPDEDPEHHYPETDLEVGTALLEATRQFMLLYPHMVRGTRACAVFG